MHSVKINLCKVCAALAEVIQRSQSTVPCETGQRMFSTRIRSPPCSLLRSTCYEYADILKAAEAYRAPLEAVEGHIKDLVRLYPDNSRYDPQSRGYS